MFRRSLIIAAFQTVLLTFLQFGYSSGGVEYNNKSDEIARNEKTPIIDTSGTDLVVIPHFSFDILQDNGSDNNSRYFATFAQADLDTQGRDIQDDSTGAQPETVESQLKSEVFKPNPTGALLRSIAFPGWGQIYNRKYIKAGIFAIGEGLLIYYMEKNWERANHYQAAFERTLQTPISSTALPSETDVIALDESSLLTLRSEVFARWQKYTDERNKYMWFLAATIFLSMFDAYVDAHLMPFDREMGEDLKAESTAPLGITIVFKF
ncbi:MAG: hypothetical protein GF315_00515 [candidate division Zixibacteria bacterium]|nr:hypothetical protein [candidate division Zixibacteria bacterium]